MVLDAADVFAARKVGLRLRKAVPMMENGGMGLLRPVPDDKRVREGAEGSSSWVVSRTVDELGVVTDAAACFRASESCSTGQ
jgi:hypothetical protein